MKLSPNRTALLFCLVLVAAFLSATSGSSQDADTIYRSANENFDKGEFAQSTLKYRSLVESGHTSPDLFYNLGTSLYREGKPGESMLWLRRSLILDPTLPEAKQNIEFLRTRIAFLEFADSAIERFLRALPRGFGHWTGSILVWLALLSLAAGFGIPRLKANRSGLVALAIVSLMAAVVASRFDKHRERFSPRHFATVTASGASALTSPVPGAKPVIDLPPGSEVRLLQVSGPWRYVDIPGELRGWVRGEHLEPVWPVPAPSS